MDKMGETALHWACKNEEDSDEMVNLLLDK